MIYTHITSLTHICAYTRFTCSEGAAVVSAAVKCVLFGDNQNLWYVVMHAWIRASLRHVVMYVWIHAQVPWSRSTRARSHTHAQKHTQTNTNTKRPPTPTHKQTLSHKQNRTRPHAHTHPKKHARVHTYTSTQPETRTQTWHRWTHTPKPRRRHRHKHKWTCIFGTLKKNCNARTHFTSPHSLVLSTHHLPRKPHDILDGRIKLDARHPQT